MTELQGHSTKCLLFATNNLHKIQEVQHILIGRLQVLSLLDMGIQTDIPETGLTLHENAIQKATFIHANYGLDCFAEDTGLEVPFLDGAPGVYTARYAGVDANANENMTKLLKELGQTTMREAQFRTIIALWLNGKLNTFEGIVSGRIAYKQEGNGGFGYDPVFIPIGYDHSFAQLPEQVKHNISHRARAVSKLVEFLTASG